MKASRLEYSGQLAVCFKRIPPTEPGAKELFEIVGIFGEQPDAQWLQSSISSVGVDATFGFGNFDAPQPPPVEFFLAHGHMRCRYFLKSEVDVDLGFFVEHFELIGPDKEHRK